DRWESFLSVFGEDNHEVGKKHPVGIAGNKCLPRHWIRRVFRRTCCFSKTLFTHWKALGLFLHQLRLRLKPIILCGSPPYILSIHMS
ncbi:MAG: hypothetical protein LBU25_07920, partial [Treponema sp.]|nr:hypothetical protein [Treponema sp.]